MPLNKLAQSLTGTCRHCGQKTGILQRIHPECRQTHQAGIQEMTQLATQAAAAHTFNETALRQTLEVWPESHWPGFALRQSDVFQSYTAQ